MRRTMMVAVMAAAVLLPVVAAAGEPLEYQLAMVDAGHWVPREDLTVARFRSLLRQLDAKFVEGPERIADVTMKARQMLRDEGVEEKMLRMMEGINDLVHEDGTGLKYTELLALYVTLRIKGRGHDATLNDLRVMLAAVGVR